MSRVDRIEIKINPEDIEPGSRGRYSESQKALPGYIWASGVVGVYPHDIISGPKLTEEAVTTEAARLEVTVLYTLLGNTAFIQAVVNNFIELGYYGSEERKPHMVVFEHGGMHYEVILNSYKLHPESRAWNHREIVIRTRESYRVGGETPESPGFWGDGFSISSPVVEGVMPILEYYEAPAGLGDSPVPDNPHKRLIGEAGITHRNTELAIRLIEKILVDLSLEPTS